MIPYPIPLSTFITPDFVPLEGRKFGILFANSLLCSERTNTKRYSHLYPILTFSLSLSASGLF